MQSDKATLTKERPNIRTQQSNHFLQKESEECIMGWQNLSEWQQFIMVIAQGLFSQTDCLDIILQNNRLSPNMSIMLQSRFVVRFIGF